MCKNRAVRTSNGSHLNFAIKKILPPWMLMRYTINTAKTIEDWNFRLKKLADTNRLNNERKLNIVAQIGLLTN